MKWSRIFSRAAAWLAVSCLVGCGGDRREETALPSSAAQPDARAPQSEASGAAPESAPAPATKPPETAAEDDPEIPPENPPETPGENPPETRADAADLADLVYGAESPRTLWERMAAAVQNKDRAELLACVHPPTASDAEKAEAEHAADMMFAGVRARELLAEAAERFSKQQVQEAAGTAAFMLAMLATGPAAFEHTPDQSEIEQDGAVAKIPMRLPMSGGAPGAQGTREVYRRGDGRWYFMPAGAADAAQAEASVKRAVETVAAFEDALAASETIEEFREQMAPLAKPMTGASDAGAGLAAPPPHLPKEPALPPGAARDAVQWALSTGASASVHVEGRIQPVSVRRQDDIPAEDFRLTGLKLNFHHEYSQEEFRRIGAMKDLLDLGCFTTDSVDDSMLSHLARLENLRTLDLRSTPVTGEGFADLTSLRKLEHLELARCPIVDEGLEHIGGLKGLTGLDLSHTEITDAGLEHLKTLTNLRSLNVSRTRVTAAGVAELKSALPNCRITPTAAELRGSAEARIWRDASGEFSVEAELVEVMQDQVVLKRTDGKTTTVPMERLSKKDQQYLASLEKDNAEKDFNEPWLALQDTQEVSKKFFLWLLRLKSIGDEDRETLIHVLQRDDAGELLAAHMRKVIELLNDQYKDRAANAALQLAKDADSLAAASIFIFNDAELRGSTPEIKQGLVDFMWKCLAEKAILRPPPFKSPDWFPSWKDDPQFVAHLEDVAENPETAFQGKAIAKLLQSDFETYFKKLEPAFKQELNMQAQLDFARTVVDESEDEQLQQKYLQFVMDFVKLDGDLYERAQKQPTFLGYDDNRAESAVVFVMAWLNRKVRLGLSTPELRSMARAAIKAGLKRICSEDDDTARLSTFRQFGRDRPFFKAIVEEVPELISWGLASEDPQVLRGILSLAAEVDSDVAHQRALAMLKSDDPHMVFTSLETIPKFERPEDVQRIAALLEHEEHVNRAVQALGTFEPIPVQHLVDVLDHSQGIVRYSAFMALRKLPGGKELEFNANAKGDEATKQKQQITDWLVENGHLKEEGGGQN